MGENFRVHFNLWRSRQDVSINVFLVCTMYSSLKGDAGSDMVKYTYFVTFLYLNVVFFFFFQSTFFTVVRFYAW